MASVAMSMIRPRISVNANQCPFNQVFSSRFSHANLRASLNESNHSIIVHYTGEGSFRRLQFPSGRHFKCLIQPICAVGSGLEASITEKKKNDISLDNVNITIESRDDDKIHVRVELSSEETQKTFDQVLTNLARTAPPMPGFRRMKGGKTSNVPKSFLLQMLGKDRVTKFLIQEIVSITIGDFVKKENLSVRSQVKTTQSSEELEAAFTPGSEFGFNATMEIEKSNQETTTSMEIEKSNSETTTSSSS